MTAIENKIWDDYQKGKKVEELAKENSVEEGVIRSLIRRKMRSS